MSRAAATRAWQVELAAFAEHQLQQGLSVETIRKRSGHLERFAAAASLEPWSLSVRAVLGWALNGGSSVNAQAERRQAVRAFYAWGNSTGRGVLDIAVLLDGRRGGLPAPTLWSEPLARFEQHMRAAGLADATIRLRNSQLERFARAHESVAPWQITAEQLTDWLSVQHWSRETRRSMRAALVGFYDWGAQSGKLSHSPASGLPRIRLATAEARPAAESAYAQALAVAVGRDRIALRLAAELGMRRGEVCQVHTSDITQTPGGAVLLVHGKGDRQRSIPLPDSLAAELQELPPGYVFPGKTDGHLSANTLGRRVRELLPQDVTMHQLRHRFASLAYAVSSDLFAVQQLLGHASPSTTQRYVQIGDSARRDVVNQVAERSPQAVEQLQLPGTTVEPAHPRPRTGRLWLSLARRDATRDWAHARAWLREADAPDAAAVAASPPLSFSDDIIEQAAAWAVTTSSNWARTRAPFRARDGVRVSGQQRVDRGLQQAAHQIR